MLDLAIMVSKGFTVGVGRSWVSPDKQYSSVSSVALGVGCTSSGSVLRGKPHSEAGPATTSGKTKLGLKGDVAGPAPP